MALDDTTLQAAIAGDRAALREVFDSLYPSVRKHLVFHLGFSDVVEDAVQESMLQVFKALPGFRRKSSIRTWALRIAIRTGRRYARRTRHYECVTIESDEIAGVVLPSTSGELRALARALVSISPKKREAFVLMEVLEMTAKEAGGALGVSPNTAASRCRHARDELRALLTEKFDESIGNTSTERIEAQRLVQSDEVV